MDLLIKEISVTTNHSIAMTVAFIMTLFSMILSPTIGATWVALLLIVLFLFAMVYAFTRVIRSIAGEMTSITREFATTFSAYALFAVVFAVASSNGTVDVSDFILDVIANSILPTFTHISIVYLYKDKDKLNEHQNIV